MNLPHQKERVLGILDARIAIVTGAGKGLGRAEALALAKEGAAVTVCARTYSDVEQTVEAIQAIGGRALALKCDVRVEQEVLSVVEQTVARFGTVDILVNNAQIMFDAHPIDEWTTEEMVLSWESGPLASWLFMKACLPFLKIRGGRVINFCSPAGHGIVPGFIGYSMAKEAVRSLTRCTAREWGRYNITVNAISPLAMSDAAERILDTPEKRAAALEMMGTALPNWGDAESDIGRSVVFLAGPDAKHITGCTLSVDGGAAML